MISVHFFTPMPSLIFLGATSIIMLFSANIYELINYLAFAESLVVFASVAGLLLMRLTRKDLDRPIKVWGLVKLQKKIYDFSWISLFRYYFSRCVFSCWYSHSSTNLKSFSLALDLFYPDYQSTLYSSTIQDGLRVFTSLGVGNLSKIEKKLKF